VLSLAVGLGLWLPGLLSWGCGGTGPGTDERATQGTLAQPSGSVACYSPTQGLETAYDPGSVGCACDSTRDEDVCVSYDDAGQPYDVALNCVEGAWRAVLDGVCMLAP